MARRDIEAGRAYVTLGLKNNLTNALRSVQKGLDVFERSAKKIGRDLVEVGKFMVGPLLAAGLASEKVRNRLTEAKDALVQALEPVLLPMVEALVKIAKKAAEWITQNQKIVALVIKIGVGMLVVGGALQFASAAASLLSFALGVAATILSIKILGPLILIGGAVAALVVLWVKFTDSGQKAAAMLQEAFGKALENIRRMVSGLAHAIMHGELRLAIDIAAAGFQAAFLSAIANVLKQISVMATGIRVAIESILPPMLRDKVFGPLFGKGDAMARAAATAAGAAAGIAEKRLKELEARARALGGGGLLGLGGEGGFVARAPVSAATTASALATARSLAPDGGDLLAEFRRLRSILAEGDRSVLRELKEMVKLMRELGVGRFGK